MGALQDLTGTVAYTVASLTLCTSFVVGYQMGVINAPSQMLREFYREVYLARYGEQIDEDTLRLLWGTVTIGMIALGGFCGAMTVGVLTNSLGRKRTILANAVVVLAGSALMASARAAASYELVIVGRFVVGVGTGLAGGAVPTYVNEISPVSLRGALGSIHQFAIVIGVLAAMVMGNSGVWGNTDNWHLLMGFTAVNAVLQILSLSICPDSPSYLVVTKQNDLEAYTALVFFRQTPYVDEEMEQLRQERIVVNSLPTVTVANLFKDPMYRRPLLVAIVCHLAQQMTGINAIIAFSTDILRSSLGDARAETVTIVTAAVNFAVTVASVVMVEKFGRRLLMLGGLVLVAADTVLLTAGLVLNKHYGTGSVPFMPLNNSATSLTSPTDAADFATWPAYIVAAGIVLFVAFYSVGPACVPWFITGEVFTQGPRASATAVSVVANYAGVCLVLFGFVEVEQLLGEYTFLIFTVASAAAVAYLAKYMPETRNRTTDDIRAEFALRLGRSQDSQVSLPRMEKIPVDMTDSLKASGTLIPAKNGHEHIAYVNHENV